MKRTFLASAAVVFGLALPAAAQQRPNWDISCEGTESGGGGRQMYQYELLNVTNQPLLLTALSITTNDMSIGNYANWTMPANWNVGVVAGGGWTNLFKTAHGAVAPPPQQGGAGWIQWTAPAAGGVNVPANGTVLFGFDNPNRSWNVDWFATPEVGNWIGANWLAPVAGPAGAFTHGPVHAPVPEPATVVMLAGAGLIGLLAYARRRRNG